MAVLFTLLVRRKPCQSTLPLVSHTYSSSPLQNLVVFLTRKWRLTTFTRSFTNMMFRHQDRSLRLHSRHVPTMAVILILDSTPWVRPWHSPTQLPPHPPPPPPHPPPPWKLSQSPYSGQKGSLGHSCVTTFFTSYPLPHRFLSSCAGLPAIPVALPECWDLPFPLPRRLSSPSSIKSCFHSDLFTTT